MRVLARSWIDLLCGTDICRTMRCHGSDGALGEGSNGYGSGLRVTSDRACPVTHHRCPGLPVPKLAPDTSRICHATLRKSVYFHYVEDLIPTLLKILDCYVDSFVVPI